MDDPQVLQVIKWWGAEGRGAFPSVCILDNSLKG